MKSNSSNTTELIRDEQKNESCEKSASEDSKLAGSLQFKGAMQISEPKFLGSSSGVSNSQQISSLQVVTHEEDDEHGDSSSRDSEFAVDPNEEKTPTKVGDG